MDFEILCYEMGNLVIPSKIAGSITAIFSGRQILIRNHNNQLYGPIVVNQGLSQGTIFSLIIFNINTGQLHERFCCNIKIVQYADDIGISTSQQNYGMTYV